MSKSIALTDETVIDKIYHIKGKEVMLDRDLVVSGSVVSRSVGS